MPPDARFSAVRRADFCARFLEEPDLPRRPGFETNVIRVAHRAEVDHRRKEILSFRGLGHAWSSRVKSLLGVIESPGLSSFEKLAAYGALFYLITPIDLVPDYIPTIGLIDDFGVLGVAAEYYFRMMKKLTRAATIARHKNSRPLPMKRTSRRVPWILRQNHRSQAT